MQGLIERGSAIAIGAIAHLLYEVADRNGVGAVACLDGALDDDQRLALAQFRFAQYLAADLVDTDIAFAQQLERDPRVDFSADTVHVMSFAADTGVLLASVMMCGPPAADRGVRFRSTERTPFQAEEHLGWGAFQRLAVLPDTPVERVREFGRLVRNFGKGHEALGPRPLIELGLAVREVLCGPLALTVDVCIGEAESDRSQRNLEFFHTPMVVARGGLPVLPAGHVLSRMFEGHNKTPFAFAVADLAWNASRVKAIEAALDAPGLAALAALQRIDYDMPSSLLPAGGLPALADTPLEQVTLPMDERRQWREAGRELQRFAALASLSETEATALRRLTVERKVEPGKTLLKRGQVANALMLVLDGWAKRRAPALATAWAPPAC